MRKRKRSEAVDRFALRWPDDYARPARNTNVGRKYALKPFVRDFKGRLFNSITRPEARRWALSQPIGTVRAVITMVNDGLNDGVFVGTNPFANLGLERSRGRRDLKTISREGVFALAACAEAIWGEYGRLVFGPLIIFDAFVGLRPAELYFAKRIDIRGDELLVIESDDGAGKAKDPKSGDPRTVWLPPEARQAISIVPPRIDVPWLFYTVRGRKFNKSNLFRYWDPVRRLYASRSETPGMAFYELRHRAGSYYTNELEVDPKDTAVQFGHKDGGLLIQTLYGHPEEKLARERIKQAYRDKFLRAPQP
jgi:integrase